MLNSGTYFTKYKKIVLSLLALSSLTACGPLSDIFPDDWEDEPVVCEADTTPVEFKKVGYWNGDDREYFEDLKYEQLTHLIYGYLTVNTDASLAAFDDAEMKDFEKMVASARAAGTKVAISIGGDGNAGNLKTIASSFSLTKLLVDNVVTFVEDNDLEGVDLNWQSPANDDEGDLFEDLVEKLSAKLREKGYFFTITVVSGENEVLGDAINSTLFAYVDFVHVRAFDSIDDGDGGDDGLHSSREDAINAINYWKGRCLIKNKLVLGIPFYSRGDRVDSYADIIDAKRADACKDESAGRNYNGIPTVIYKTNYAMSHAGGVMIHSLEQDTYMSSLAEYSLLNVISATAAGDTVSLCE